MVKNWGRYLRHLGGANAAAWVQAFGSIVALVVALYIAQRSETATERQTLAAAKVVLARTSDLVVEFQKFGVQNQPQEAETLVAMLRELYKLADGINASLLPADSMYYFLMLRTQLAALNTMATQDLLGKSPSQEMFRNHFAPLAWDMDLALRGAKAHL